jgi:hypothetical protein
MVFIMGEIFTLVLEIGQGAFRTVKVGPGSSWRSLAVTQNMLNEGEE